jgi:hypothetical protein
VNTLTEISFSLSHQLTDEEHIRGSTITDDIVLGGGSTANHGSSWVLDLLHNIWSLGGPISKFLIYLPFHGVEHYHPL